MNKKLFIFLLVVLTFFGICNAVRADTGTYRILDYSVYLTPMSDGKVKMDYYQKWSVESGHIPWTTVGLANSSFEITGSDLNVREIRPANEGGWSGVRMELDKDYQPGETFEISFSILQNQLFYADDESYRLDFTPGWYDRAFTDHLAIDIRFFADISTIATDPEPDRTEDEVMSWEWTSLGKGQRVSVSVSFPKETMPNVDEANLKQGIGAGGVILIVFLVIVIVLFICFIAWVNEEMGGGSGYGGGSIFSGGSSGSGYSGGSSGRSSSGGGGFGGRSSSCACACVACACACACAGGGGAGCSKKTNHSCALCKEDKSHETL
ncbi:hypothetical protein ACFL14_01100 [Patescibacteria group bacterium]